MDTAGTLTPSGQRSRWLGYLQLMRPANMVTALADILAGIAAAGALGVTAFGSSGPSPAAVLWLLAATAGLYGGGIVFNDVCDAALDRVERPERPIPSGLVPRAAAALLGSVLLVSGIVCALQVSLISGLLALAVAVCALTYDLVGKHHALAGPLNMGLCRALNLLLGLSIVPEALANRWFIGLIPLVYIGAITTLSRGEVHGGDQRTGGFALALLAAVMASLILLAWLPDYSLLPALPFILFLGWRIFPPFLRATRQPQPALIQAAVKAGILSLIALNAILVAGFAGWVPGLIVLALLLLSGLLARVFAVT